MKKIEILGLIAYELSSACALVFGQTAAAIPVAIIRGYEYEINETANVANSLIPKASPADMAKAIKASMRATSYTRGLKKRILLRIASWFV